MKKVIIASDSTTDLSSELIERYDIRILPMFVSLGENTYMVGVDLDPDRIYKHFEETGELPKTTAINLARFNDFYKECLKEAQSVVFITLGSDLSSTFNNARTVALDYDDIYVVSDDEAIQTAQNLARMEGLMCGISSGTNVAAALALAEKLGPGKTVVTILPDTAERYFSTPLFKE